MRSEPDDLQILINKYRTMDIEELKENIDNWQKENDCFTELQSLDIAKKELELKYKRKSRANRSHYNISYLFFMNR